MPSLPATHRLSPFFCDGRGARRVTRESSGRTQETSFQQRNHGEVVPSPGKCESASHLNPQGGGVPLRWPQIR